MVALRGEEVEVSRPERSGQDGDPEETLPPGVDEPDSEKPEADTLEQQLPPESGETSPQDEPYQEEELRGEPPKSESDANDADKVEQKRAVEDDDEYRAD